MIDTKNKKLVFVDMDGVLCDLDGTLAAFDGYTCKLAWFRREYDAVKYSNNIGQFYRERIGKYLQTHNLFAELKPMSDMLELVTFLADQQETCDIHICTSAMDNHLSSEVRKQKIEWVRKHLLPYELFKSVIVTKCQNTKVDVAKQLIEVHNYKSFVMIDDMDITYDAFTAAGLACIQHTSAATTIKKFMEMK